MGRSLLRWGKAAQGTFSGGVENYVTFWTRTAGAVVFGAVLLMTAAQASAQGSFGVYGVTVSESVGGERVERGLGLRAGLSFPLFPLMSAMQTHSGSPPATSARSTWLPGEKKRRAR